MLFRNKQNRGCRQAYDICFIELIVVLMARLSSLRLLYLLLTVSTSVLDISCYAAEEERQVYIVYMGGLPQQGEYSVSSYHMDMLQKVVHDSQSLVRSYTRSFNAFAAKLTYKEREKLASFKEVLSIFPSRTLRTQTTRSWDFMGFPENVDRKQTSESNIIVGLIDSGIWPESPSFDDQGFGPPPKKWKGVCKGGKNFTCNRKLIGARYYVMNSTRDEYGHGTHTASTATGRKVKDTSFYGLGQGTARGAVPSARIAAYKVCDYAFCPETFALAAFDDAIADGVDIISISIDSEDPTDIISDAMAIGAFHAMQKGILTVQSAGNNGPKPGVITSVVPWVFTVGASTIDRTFINKVGLGNGQVIKGSAIDTFKRGRAKFPLVYGKDVSSTCSELNSQICAQGCLNSSLIRNKIVVCNDLADSAEAYEAGAAGIIKKIPPNFPAFISPFPESALTHNKFAAVLNYMNSTRDAGRTPKAYISASKSVRDRFAPKVAWFSARGPNPIIPDILKPDVTAPGAAILAAYSPASVLTFYGDKRFVNYAVISGTSMACPHVSGAAAYVKSFHPNWSPAAIKSALMTTAWSLKETKTANNEFAYGAGHINPAKAVNPGLVYDTSTEDYIKLICGLGYNTTILRQITGDNSSCPRADKVKTKHNDLNYPSMTAKVATNKAFSVKFLRRVTNVGEAKSEYKIKIKKNSDMNVVVEPRILRFNALNVSKSFVVRVEGKIRTKSMISASIEWSDGIHKVRSPIVVYDDSAFNKQH